MIKDKTQDENNLNAEQINYDNFIEYLDLKLIDMENFAASLLVIGYGLYINAGSTDTSELLNPDIEENSSADNIFILGQKFVLTGYITLYTVSLLRIQEKKFEIALGDKALCIEPFIAISQTYLASIFINYYRLKAFIDIKIDNQLDRQDKEETDSSE